MTGDAVLRARRARDPRLRAARDDVARGRLLLRDRRRLRGRGGQVLRLDARRRSRPSSATRTRASFCAYYDVDSRGNWEGHSILNTSRTGPAVAARWALEPRTSWSARVAALRERLYEARRAARAAGARRQGPDGLERPHDRRHGRGRTACSAIPALPRGRRTRGRAVRAARPAARRTAALLRTCRAGTAGIDAYLEDYAYLGEALVDLYEAGGDEDFLHEAQALAERIRARLRGGRRRLLLDRGPRRDAHRPPPRGPRRRDPDRQRDGGARCWRGSASHFGRDDLRAGGRAGRRRLRQGDRPPAARVRFGA